MQDRGKLYDAVRICLVKSMIAVRFHRCLQWLHRKRVIILMYHGFFDESRPEGIEQYGHRWCGIQKFKEQMGYLKRHFNVIPLRHLAEHYTTGREIPERTVVVTMDDGYKSNYLLAYPVLKQKQIPATIFISTDFVENEEYLWADRLEYSIWKAQINTLRIKINNDNCSYKTGTESDKIQSVREMKSKLYPLSYNERARVIEDVENRTGIWIDIGDASGLQSPLQWSEIEEMDRGGIVVIGSHGVRHPNLTTCTDEELEEEVVESRRLIEQRIGRKCELFCYPGGRFDERVKRFVVMAGYSCAVAVEGRFETRENGDRFELTRVSVGRTMSFSDFVLRLCSFRERVRPKRRSSLPETSGSQVC